MPIGHGSREPWTHREEEIVCRFYDKGVGEVAALLPGRTVEAIRQRAVRLGVAGSTPAGLRKPCASEDREAIMGLHDQGMGYEAIARIVGVKPQAVSNAILAIECERAGFVPAQRDGAGGLIQQEVQRIRAFIREGLPNVEIQRRMAVSAACVSNYRRRMKRSGEDIVPAGKGLRYAGTRYGNDVRQQVDQHFMQGYGAAKVADLAGVHVSFAKKRRRHLVERLARKGECLPGCDITGRRIHVKQSSRFVTEQQKVDLQWLWLNGWAVSPAARHLGIGASTAHNIIRTAKDQLVADGKPFPRMLPQGKRPQLGHTPTSKAKGIAPRPRPSAVSAMPALKRAPTIIAAPCPPKPVVVAAPPPPPRRRLSFEEQLARIAAGAGLVPTFKPTRAVTEATLGGVGSALL